MGRPRIKVMDDSQAEPEIKSRSVAKAMERRRQKSKIKTKSDLVKTSNKKGQAKSEADKASGEVEPTILEARSDSEKKSMPPVILEGAQRPIESDQKDAIAEFTLERSEGLQHDKTKKSQKPGKAKPRSKKYQEMVKDLDRTKTYSLPEAVDMVKKLSYAKFNATLEAHITTLQTGLRGLVSLPYAKGRQLRILAFGPSTASQLEGVVFGADSTIEDINKGKIEFDLIITTPEWMPKLAKVARTLGPKGLMPNPKNNTIVSDEAGLKKTVEGFQAGKTEYKTESKATVIHIALGKLSQPNEELVANIKTLLIAIGKSRIKKVSLSPTMGPSVKLDLSSF